MQRVAEVLRSNKCRLQQAYLRFDDCATWNILDGFRPKDKKANPFDRASYNRSMNNVKNISLARMAFDKLGLTNLQVAALNEIGQNIEDGHAELESYNGLLTEAEEKYLKARIGEDAV